MASSHINDLIRSAALKYIETGDLGEYITFEPTVAAASGTITSYTSSGTYTRIGDMVHCSILVTITNHGTGAGDHKVTPPFNAAFVSTGIGRENGVSGALLQGNVSTGSAILSCLTSANATPIATNAQVRMTITYRAAAL